MQIVCFSSIKGGAGKTTSLMIIASAVVDQGMCVGLLETDDNEPLAAWREYALEFETWDDALCKVYAVKEAEDLQKAFEAAERDGVELLMIDTRGGGSEFNDTIMLNSDLVIIPTGLSIMEMDEALLGLDFALETLKGAKRPVIAAILANRVSSEKRMPVAHREALDLLKEVPCFVAHLKNRQVFQDIKGIGLLGAYLEKLEGSSVRQMMTANIRAYLGEGQAVADEMLNQLQPAEVA